MVAGGIEQGTAAYVGHVRACVGLAPALGPHIFAAGHARQKALFLGSCAKFHERGAEQQNAVLVDTQRTVGAGVLFFEDQPLDEVAAAPAQRFGPSDAAPAALGQARLPLAVLLEAFACVVACQRAVRRVRLEPGAHLGTKSVLFGGIAELHGGLLAGQNLASRFCTKAARVSAESGLI